MARRPASRDYDLRVDVADPAAAIVALDAAKAGLRVVIVDRERIELPNEFPRRAGIVEETCRALGVATEVVESRAGEENIFGIPAHAFSRKVQATLGAAGAWRVYADRLMPVIRIGNERRFERLVTKRLGRRAWSEIVLPRCTELCAPGTDVANLDVTDVAPGLVEAMSRVGSLTLGVIELMAADERAVQTVRIVGGVEALWRAIDRQCENFAVARLTPDDPAPRVTATLSGDVAMGTEAPTLDRALERGIDAGASLRERLLWDPENPPVGPPGIGD